MSHQGGHLGAWAFNRKWQPLPETHAWPHLRHASGTCAAGNAFAQCMFNACSVCHPSDTSTANIAVQELGPSTAVSPTQLQIEKLFTPQMKLVKRTVSGFFFTPRVLCPEESCGNNMVRKLWKLVLLEELQRVRRTLLLFCKKKVHWAKCLGRYPSAPICRPILPRQVVVLKSTKEKRKGRSMTTQKTYFLSEVKLLWLGWKIQSIHTDLESSQ